jgi:hypothetical protein
MLHIRLPRTGNIILLLHKAALDGLQLLPAGRKGSASATSTEPCNCAIQLNHAQQEEPA